MEKAARCQAAVDSDSETGGKTARPSYCSFWERTARGVHVKSGFHTPRCVVRHITA